MGESYLKDRITSPAARAALADALLTPIDKASITDPRAKMFRAFADQPGKDRSGAGGLHAGHVANVCRLRPWRICSGPVLVVDGREG